MRFPSTRSDPLSRTSTILLPGANSPRAHRRCGNGNSVQLIPQLLALDLGTESMIRCDCSDIVWHRVEVLSGIGGLDHSELIAEVHENERVFPFELRSTRCFLHSGRTDGFPWDDIPLKSWRSWSTDRSTDLCWRTP